MALKSYLKIRFLQFLTLFQFTKFLQDASNVSQLILLSFIDQLKRKVSNIYFQ